MEIIKLLLLIFTLIFTQAPYSKVEPPNYHFTLDELSPFYPDKEVSSIPEKFGKGEFISGEGDNKTLKFMMKHNRFVFPILVQTQKGKILDMYARLPNYFLHDVFHQSIINRYGKQDVYRLVDEHAVYIWHNKNDLRLVYMGACSITCFPVFFSVSKPKEQWSPEFKPLVEKMEDLVRKEQK